MKDSLVEQETPVFPPVTLNPLEQLRYRKALLEVQLKEVNECLAALEKLPDVVKLLTMLRKVGL